MYIMNTYITCIVAIVNITTVITITLAISIAITAAFPVQCNTWWNVADPALSTVSRSASSRRRMAPCNRHLLCPLASLRQL